MRELSLAEIVKMVERHRMKCRVEGRGFRCEIPENFTAGNPAKDKTMCHHSIDPTELQQSMARRQFAADAQALAQLNAALADSHQAMFSAGYSENFVDAGYRQLAAHEAQQREPETVGEQSQRINQAMHERARVEAERDSQRAHDRPMNVTPRPPGPAVAQPTTQASPGRSRIGVPVQQRLGTTGKIVPSEKAVSSRPQLSNKGDMIGTSTEPGKWEQFNRQQGQQQHDGRPNAQALDALQDYGFDGEQDREISDQQLADEMLGVHESQPPIQRQDHHSQQRHHADDKRVQQLIGDHVHVREGREADRQFSAALNALDECLCEIL
jgi:hypothetical protein